jgi:hypothetical protein
MARKNAIATVRVSVSVDPTTSRVLEAMVPVGLHGKNKAEVASWVIREWIWHNQEALARFGIHVGPRSRSRAAPPCGTRS